MSKEEQRLKRKEQLQGLLRKYPRPEIQVPLDSNILN